MYSYFVQCCFTSSETVRFIRDGGAHDGHLDFHTAPELSSFFAAFQCCFTSTETIRDGETRTATSSLISLVVSVDVKHHVYLLGRPPRLSHSS